MNLDIDFIRAQYPVFSNSDASRWAMFENAGGSYVPKQVSDRLHDFFQYTKVQPYGPFASSIKAGEAMDGGYRAMAGLMNCDPKKFDDAVQLPQISYHEAIELAFYGASVIHPKTIQPLQQKNIPLFVRSFYNPESMASRISDDTSHDSDIHKVIRKAPWRAGKFIIEKFQFTNYFTRGRTLYFNLHYAIEIK